MKINGGLDDGSDCPHCKAGPVDYLKTIYHEHKYTNYCTSQHPVTLLQCSSCHVKFYRHLADPDAGILAEWTESDVKYVGKRPRLPAVHCPLCGDRCIKHRTGGGVIKEYSILRCGRCSTEMRYEVKV